VSVLILPPHSCSISYCTRSFNGWGVTAFDSLDTMLLMGLKDEYASALEIVRQANFSTSTVCSLWNRSK